MKKLFLLPLIVFLSCQSNADRMEQAVKNLHKKSQTKRDSITKEIEDLEKGIFSDNRDYTNTDCKNWIESTTDKMTGKTTTRIKNRILVGALYLESKKKYKLLEQHIEINVYEDKNKEIVLVFKCFGGGSCVDSEDKINILFIDNSKLELKNESGFNCDANSVVWFNKKSKNLKTLKEKKISAIRVRTSRESVQCDFSDNNAIHLINVLNCLTEK